MQNWPLFVNKQLFWWSPSITFDNNNDVLADLYLFSSLYTSVGLTVCSSIVFSVVTNKTHLTTAGNVPLSTSPVNDSGHGTLYITNIEVAE